MVVKAFTYENAGTYYPTATCNGYTTVSAEPVVVGQGTLPAPTNMAIVNPTMNGGTVVWDNLTTPSFVTYTLTTSPASETFTSNGSPFTLTGLDPDTAYTVTLRASAEGWNDSEAVTADFTTQPEPQLPTPANLAVEDITFDTGTARWDTVEDATTYTVTLDPADVGPFTVSDNTQSLTGLSEETEYTISVVAKADNFSDSEPATAQFTTDGKPALGPIQNFQSSVVTATTANLSWDLLENADTFTVTLDPPDVGPFTDIINPGEEITGLTPETAYTASVKAVADGYVDSPTATTEFTTTAE